MTFYHIINDQFWLKKTVISNIYNILRIITILCIRQYDITVIKSFLLNFSKDDIVLHNVNKFKYNDVINNYDLHSFLNAHNKYKHDYVFNLIISLLRDYVCESVILATALFKLIEATERIHFLAGVVGVSNTSRVVRRFKNELRFLKHDMPSLIYRELYLSYLQSRYFNVLSTSYVNVPSTIENIHVNTLLPNQQFPKLHAIFKLVLFNEFIVDIRVLKNLIVLNHDFYNLITSQECSRIIINNLKDIIQKIYKFDFNTLNRHLQDSNAVISGSSTLQCFYGRSNCYSTSSDLDIYVQNPFKDVQHVQSLFEYIQQTGYVIVPKVRSTITQTYHYVPFHSREDYVLQELTFKKNNSNRKIQIIVVDIGKEPLTVSFGNFVTSKFDFSFLQNYYDGNNLFVHQISHIISRTGIINENVLRDSSYNYNGLYHNIEDIHNYFLLNTQLRARLLKYRARGFSISYVHDDKNLFY